MGIRQTVVGEHDKLRILDDLGTLVSVREALCNAYRGFYDDYANRLKMGFVLVGGQQQVTPIFKLIGRECFEKATDDELRKGITIHALRQRLASAYKREHKAELAEGYLRRKVKDIVDRQTSQLFIYDSPDDKVRIDDYDLFFLRKWGNPKWPW